MFGIKDIFTTINVLGGVVGICLCIDGRPFEASVAIMIGYAVGDTLDLEFDNIAVFKEAIIFEPAPARHSAGPEHFTGVHRLVAADMGKHVFEAVIHLAGIAAAPFFAVDPGDHGEVVGVGDFVCGHYAGTKHVTGVEVLAAAAQTRLAAHVLRLNVAGAHVVENGVTVWIDRVISAGDGTPAGVVAK